MTNIRTGQHKDLPALLNLIKELATYEHSLDQVSNTIEKMVVDGFGDNPIFGFIVAEKGDVIIGASIYYYRYSTWKGKRIYLEDLIVTEAERGNGFGKQLFEATIAIGKSTQCTGMMWQVLDWNEPAINFYKKYDAVMEDNWTNCNLDFL
ncbi:MAG: GNAT superfamily N-acetyltransferase [Cyclobacteriaceae bacterium]|jgi:GNAT superfamily N-acetyltransferase